MVAITAFLLLGLIVLPIVSVSVVAGFETWRLRGHDNYAITIALVDVVNALNSPKGIANIDPGPMSLPGCDVDIDRLPDWMIGEKRNYATWGPSDALFKMDSFLSTLFNRWGGTNTVQIRYISDHTSEFEQRFLLGCINATAFAPLCASRVRTWMAAADAAPVPFDLAQRTADLERWKQKALCALARGLSLEKFTTR